MKWCSRDSAIVTGQMTLNNERAQQASFSRLQVAQLPGCPVDNQ